MSIAQEMRLRALEARVAELEQRLHRQNEVLPQTLTIQVPRRRGRPPKSQGEPH